MPSASAHNNVAAPSSADPASLGPIAPAEFRALVSGCAIFPLDRSRIALTGSDRTRWLNGMVTNNVRDLAPGNGVYAFLLNPQGHIQCDLYAYNAGDSLLVELERPLAEKALPIFDHYIIMDDVEVADITAQTGGTGIAGPQSAEILQRAGVTGDDFSTMRPLEFRNLTWLNVSATVVRIDSPRPAYSLWLPSEFVEQARTAMVSAGAVTAAAPALNAYRIAQGIPLYGSDIRERDLPQETEQARALNFSKGCYVGQEIVERIRSRGAVHRKFTGFEIEGALPAPGTKLQDGGKDLGEITSVAELPAGLAGNAVRRLALGYVRREAATPGKALSAGSATATVHDLPFPNIFET
jgi:folate-binding protein YgfZ